MKTIALALLGLCFSLPAFAQGPPPQHNGTVNRGEKKTFTGCVAQEHGKILLKTKDYPKGVQLMSGNGQDFSSHVGHTVTVKGRFEQSMGSAEGTPDIPGSESDMPSMNVKTLTMVSDSCSMK